jgi:endonuclease III
MRPPKRPRSSEVPSRAAVRHAARVLPGIDERLREAYHTKSLGNLPDPLDELIYIQLSIRTPEYTYQDTYRELAAFVGGDWGRLLELDDQSIIALLRRGGMAEVKLSRLRGQLQQIIEAFGSATLDPLREMSDGTAELFLMELPGVGLKAARCVLMYSLGRDVFPVDSHCRRVLGRVGLLPASVDRKRADEYLQALVPAPIRHSLHVNLVHHGRAVCLPRRPRCQICPILHVCEYGKRCVAQQRSDGRVGDQ